MAPNLNITPTRAPIPELMCAKDIQGLGIGRDRAREIMNRADLPVFQLGKKKYVRSEKFFAWLDAQAEAAMAGMEGYADA
jgi:hypothetical protein